MTPEEIQASFEEEQRLRKKRFLVVMASLLAVIAGIIGWFYKESLRTMFTTTSNTTCETASFMDYLPLILIIIGMILICIPSKSGVATAGNVCHNGRFQRLCIFLIFHICMAYVLYLWVDYFICNLSQWGFFPFIWWCLISLFVSWSVVDSFDAKSIKFYEKGQIYYFKNPYYCNVNPGLVCFGLPRWLGGISIETVDFRKKNILIGLIKDGKREDFIVECNGFRAIFDIAFEISPHCTHRVLQLEGNTEKRLVTFVNEAVYRIANSTDQTGTKRFPNIDDLKKSTGIISNEIFGDETLRQKLFEIGYVLHSVNLKDVENEDRQVITAAQAAAAQRYLEQAEMISLSNTLDKAKLLYQKLNNIGEPDEFSEDKRVSMLKCVEIVERAEKTRTTVEFVGSPGSRPIVGLSSLGAQTP